MLIALIFNPVSGAGRAAAAAEQAGAVLRQAGHEVRLVPTELAPTSQWLDPVMQGCDLAVIAGGDGAVRLAAPSACRTNTPIYHLPYGTENLFAREFGMDARPETLLRAIAAWQTRALDVGRVNGRCFLLMVSVGFDAEVVHDLAGRRGASISHFSYLAPVLRQLRRWRPPPLEVTVEGERLVTRERGFVVVANCRHYGWRLNPAGRASMCDGLLDVVFFPASGRRALIAWALRCRLQRHLRHAALVYRTGRAVTISSDQPLRYQIDGDPPGLMHELGEEGGTAPVVADTGSAGAERPLWLSISLDRACLHVLIP